MLESDGRLLRSQATRQALIDAARQVFLSKGYREATVDDVTHLAGVAHGTFYTHFSGKDDILVHALNDLFVAFYSVQEREPFRPSSVSEAKRIVADQMSTFFHLGQEWKPLLRVLLEAIRGSATVRQYWEEEVVARLVRQAEEDERYVQSVGLARPLNTHVVARAIIAMGTFFLWQLVQEHESPADIPDIVDTLAEIYVRGFYVQETRPDS